MSHADLVGWTTVGTSINSKMGVALLMAPQSAGRVRGSNCGQVIDQEPMPVGVEGPAVGGEPLERLKPLGGEVRPGPVALAGDGDQAAVEHALDGGGDLRSALVRPSCPTLDQEALADAGGLADPA